MVSLIATMLAAGAASHAMSEQFLHHLKRAPIELGKGLAEQDYKAWRKEQQEAYDTCVVKRYFRAKKAGVPEASLPSCAKPRWW